MKRLDLAAILRNPAQRKSLMVDNIIATQAREGIETTQAQAEAAYDKVRSESLHARVAEALDWTEEDARSFSLQSLRDAVRSVSPVLAAEISQMIAFGKYITGSP
jgi:hypothetical protein